MPYKNLEISPSKYNKTFTDKKSQFYRGFSTLIPENRGTKLYDYDLVKQNIINHFNTRKGSRVMNPEFGTIIWDMLMEPLTDDTKNVLLQDITKICKFDPRAYPLQINLVEYEQGYLVEITLMLKNTDQSSVLRLAFDQKLGLQVQ
jgi:phage baseplate assembly protein W